MHPLVAKLVRVVGRAFFNDVEVMVLDRLTELPFIRVRAVCGVRGLACGAGGTVWPGNTQTSRGCSPCAQACACVDSRTAPWACAVLRFTTHCRRRSCPPCSTCARDR